MKAGDWTRRGFLGSAGAMLLSSCRRSEAVATGDLSVQVWQGIGFGIEMRMELHGVDLDEAARLGRMCNEEIEALEQAFSLYLEGSELSQLNRQRRLDRPSPLFREVLDLAIELQRRTLGFYQPAIHGAWRWLEQQGFRVDGDAAAWQAHLDAANLDGLQYGAGGALMLTHALVQLSMNAIGQGVLADRVAQRFQREGVRHALLHLGETRAMGTHPSGRSWRLAVMGTTVEGQRDLVGEVELADAGMAVSANEATRVLIDPVNRCLQQRDRVAAVVSAEGAAVADAFATAIAVAPADCWQRLTEQLVAGGTATVRVWEENRLAYAFPDHS